MGRSWVDVGVSHTGILPQERSLCHLSPIPLAHKPYIMAWAGLKFQRDTERSIGQPQVWATERDLVPMRRWVRRWKARTGIL